MPTQAPPPSPSKSFAGQRTLLLYSPSSDSVESSDLIPSTTDEDSFLSNAFPVLSFPNDSDPAFFVIEAMFTSYLSICWSMQEIFLRESKLQNILASVQLQTLLAMPDSLHLMKPSMTKGMRRTDVHIMLTQPQKRLVIELLVLNSWDPKTALSDGLC